jgi:hypothetical protein
MLGQESALPFLSFLALTEASRLSADDKHPLLRFSVLAFATCIENAFF